MHCGPDPDRLTSCKLRFDRRRGTRPRAASMHTQLPRRREVAEAPPALVDRSAGEDDEADGVGRLSPEQNNDAARPVVISRASQRRRGGETPPARVGESPRGSNTSGP